MKLPINWLENYIKLEHNLKEFGNIMTGLEFMQDGPIEDVNGQPVIDLEVRQNRSDCYSIIGLAREYAAYLGKKITPPEHFELTDLKIDKPHEILSVPARSLTKRFFAVKIENIKVKESPEWMKQNLEAYGVPSISNIVDITNYVMLEYGMPLHAFDLNTLTPNKEGGLLEVRKAVAGETINTWQGTLIKLTPKDLIIASGDEPVAIAGITGGNNSGIQKNTKNIILESACYDQATVRRTAIEHNIRTEASSRHEKFLNPEMVEVAIKRALYLIKELCGGEITLIEDFYEDEKEPTVINFNLYEISRIGGVQIENFLAVDLLNKLGFEIIDQKEAIGLNQNIIVVKVPAWRTDVKIEADVLEEILRLWGYENIPLQALKETPKDYSTTPSIQLEEKLKDILLSLGLDEHITNPLVKFSEDNKQQIILENPLNQDKNALRTNIIQTLKPAIETNKKSGQKEAAVFESGKIYKKFKEGDFREEKCITTLYYGHDFLKKIKPDFVATLSKININHFDLTTKEDEKKLNYYYDKELLASLRADGYDLYIEKLVNIVNLQNIPALRIQKNIPQRIYQELSFHITPSVDLAELSKAIYTSDDYIKSVNTLEKYKPENSTDADYALGIEVLIEDPENKLTGEKIEEIRERMIAYAEKTGARLRK